LTPEKLKERIASLIFEKKGADVLEINLNGITTITDYFIICTAESDVQVKAIADNIEKSLKDEGVKIWHKEGYLALHWVLLDYVDVVVHIFQKETREYYNLEKLWGDADIVHIEDPLLKKKEPKQGKSIK